MDIPTLAATATSLLAPALPYLATAGEKGAEVLGEKLGIGALDTAKAIWRKLSPAVEASPSANEAAQDVANAPADADAQAALRRQLKKILAADESLAAALVQLLEKSGSYHAEVHGEGAVAQGPGAVAAGKGGVAVGKDVHGGVRVGGTEFIGTQVKRES